MKRKGLTIGKVRTSLYRTGKILGDVNSIKRGTYGKRVKNRILGKLFGKFFS